MGQPIFCPRCRKTIDEKNFFKHRNGQYDELCKPCLSAHINNWDPETFLWILERLDFPYVPEEWNVLRDRQYEKDPVKFGPLSVIGRYVGKMRLNKWKNFGWADSEQLQMEAERAAAANAEAREADIRNIKDAYERGEISESQYKTFVSLSEPEDKFIYDPTTKQVVREGEVESSPFPLNNPGYEEVDLPDFAETLTQEDKVYLALKWGRLYTAAEWITMERKYKEYEESFDLHTVDLISGTIQLCKLDLKMNQALDAGDTDVYSKLARAHDTLRKSMKFTEAQRKEEKEEEFNCYGVIVSFCEMYNDEDYIPPISLEVDRDIVDEDIRDIKNHTTTLIQEDPAVFKMIEEYIKKRTIADEMETDAENGDFELTDEDFAEHSAMIEEELALDRERAKYYDDEEDEEE